MKKNLGYNQKGFTLIETLFAILIFSAALISLMTIAGRGIAATGSAREQLEAHYLAQEGLEVVRNIRDQNFVSHGNWDDGFTQCTSTSPCKLVYGNPQTAVPTLTTCVFSGGGCLVYGVNGAYVDQTVPGAAPLAYSREVYVKPATDEYEVVSKVIWTSRTIQRTVELDTILKKWE